ncbi:MAG: 2-oxoacid:ferredoxin oxidoreductase subunit beta, partial [Ignavibacteria bacterium]
MPEELEQSARGGQNGSKAAVTAKDFASDQDVRWCPGCGDYSILAQVQRIMPSINVPKEKLVFVAGIGCSSRFPYYMNTYGFHGIHGRASAIAAGLKMARPDLDVWIATGDGDLLSIGGNHLIHLLRRNIDTTILLFNNRIYGLTKGQYSPTSELGKITKSTPYGSIDFPFNPISLALGSSGTFVARTMDRDPKHLQEMVLRCHKHKGTSYLEIFQNCNIYNDGAFFLYTEKETRADNVVYLEHGKPLVFGKENDKGIKLDGFKPVIVSLKDGKHSVNDLLVHDEKSRELALILSEFTENPDFPAPVGVFLAIERS